MNTPMEQLLEKLSAKDTIIISQAKEIVALEEKLEIGLQLIHEGLDMINQIQKGKN